MKKFIALILATLMIAACFAACAPASDPAQDQVDSTPAADAADATEPEADATEPAESDLAYIQANGKIVVGITDYAPMDFKDENGEWTGFDAEFAQLFAEELGVTCEFFVLADWGKKFVELDTKIIDAVWNGMTITEEGKLNASISDPYVINAQVVVMKADKVADYADAESMKNLTFAVENGSAGQTAVVDMGIPENQIIATQDQAAALLEVKSGTSDACVIDITMAKAMTGEGTNYADLAEGISLTSEEYGVAFRTGSDLTAKFNEFMDKLIEDGTLTALAEKYSLTLAE